MKLLITGHHGQVGQALIQQAAAHNFQVAAYDRSELDIANRAAVLQTVEREQPAVIINAAAYTPTSKPTLPLPKRYTAKANWPANKPCKPPARATSSCAPPGCSANTATTS